MWFDVKCGQIILTWTYVPEITLCPLKTSRIWPMIWLKRAEKTWPKGVCGQFECLLLPPVTSLPVGTPASAATLRRSARVAKTARLWKADFLLKNTSKRPVSHLCVRPSRRSGGTQKESNVGAKSAQPIEFALAGCDAKTGWTKSEFRDICQNKLAKLSADVFSPLWRALALHFSQQDKLVAPFFHCFCASYQPSEHDGRFLARLSKGSCSSVSYLQFLNIRVEFKCLWLLHL